MTDEWIGDFKEIFKRIEKFQAKLDVNFTGLT